MAENMSPRSSSVSVVMRARCESCMAKARVKGTTVCWWRSASGARTSRKQQDEMHAEEAICFGVGSPKKNLDGRD